MLRRKKAVQTSITLRARTLALLLLKLDKFLIRETICDGGGRADRDRRDEVPVQDGGPVHSATGELAITQGSKIRRFEERRLYYKLPQAS